jgi:hypothetical protein
MGLVVAGLAVSTAWFGRELLRQQGGMLLRLDALEHAAPSAPGLPEGAPAPWFAVDAWGGGELSLDGLLASGLPLLLVFSDPHCGPCAAAVPVVASAQRAAAGRLTISVVSNGATPESEAGWREHQLDYVGVAADSGIAGRYGLTGSPAAVLISPAGRIDSPWAFGLGQVSDLLRASAGSGPDADGEAADRLPVFLVGEEDRDGAAR